MKAMYIHTYTVALSPTGGSRQQGGEFQGFTPFHSPSLVTHRRGPFRGGGSQTPRPDICICLNRSLAPFLRAADKSRYANDGDSGRSLVCLFCFSEGVVMALFYVCGSL